MVRHERDALLRLLPLGNIVDNNNQMSRHSRGIAGYDAARRQNTCLAFRHFDFIVAGRPPAGSSWRAQLPKRLPVAAIGGAVLAALTAGVFFVNREPPAVAEVPVAEARPRIDAASIAVLPFADLSAGGDQEYFSDGIAEEILHVLARFPELKVAGRTSSFKFKGVNEDLRVVGRQLGVAYLLEGSVRKQGERVRITAQLIKAEDGFHLWSETFDRDLTDIFAVQDEISRAIAEALSLRIGGAATARGGTASAAAHDLSLRGRQKLNKRGEGLREAAELFAAATALDPDYSAAHSGRARALSLIWDYSYENDPRVWEEAKRSADKAVAADPDNAEAYSVLGYLDHFYFWDWESAERNVRRALELAPNDAEIANFAGDFFIYMQNFKDGFAWEERAAELDPLHAVNFMDLSWRSLAAGRCEDALAYGDKTLEIDPAFIFVVMARAQAEQCLKRFADARRSVAALAASGLKFPLLQVEAPLDFAQGKIAAARAGLERLKEAGEKGEVSAFAVASLAASLGDHEAAAAWIERAYKNRDTKFLHDFARPLPEDWPDDPAIRAALDKPELNALFEIRRKNLAAYPREDARQRPSAIGRPR